MIHLSEDCEYSKMLTPAIGDSNCNTITSNLNMSQAHKHIYLHWLRIIPYLHLQTQGQTLNDHNAVQWWTQMYPKLKVSSLFFLGEGSHPEPVWTEVPGNSMAPSNSEESPALWRVRINSDFKFRRVSSTMRGIALDMQHLNTFIYLFIVWTLFWGVFWVICLVLEVNLPFLRSFFLKTDNFSYHADNTMQNTPLKSSELESGFICRNNASNIEN